MVAMNALVHEDFFFALGVRARGSRVVVVVVVDVLFRRDDVLCAL